MKSLGAQSRGFRFRCCCRDGKSAPRSAQLHDTRAGFLLRGGNIFPPAMCRERETRRVRKSLLSSPGSSLEASCFADPPAPQGAVPRTHQAHQDQLAIALAKPALKAVHWNPRPAASGSLGLVSFFSLSGPCARAIDRYWSHTMRRDRDRA